MIAATSPRIAAGFLSFLATLVVVGCNPGAQEAKRLQQSCKAGAVDDCHEFALRALRGDHVLQDRPTAAILFARACAGEVAESCSELGTWDVAPGRQGRTKGFHQGR